jgi:capsular exopolysaccharide synthesis family protein
MEKVSQQFWGFRVSLQKGANDSPLRGSAEGPGKTKATKSAEVPLSGFEDAAAVVCHVRPENRIVGCGENYEFGAEKFRFLRHRLTQLQRRRPISKLLVTSSIPKEGKTLVAINLAASLASRSQRVLLLDVDLRQPSIQSTLGLPPTAGLAEFLEGKAELGSIMRRVDPLGFFYLSAGKASVNPFELLEGSRIVELMALATTAFDWVVMDSPPLIPFADAHRLAVLADAVLLVARPGVTPRETLRQTLSTLESVQIAGVILNDSDDRMHDDYYYHYYPRDSTSGNGSTRLATIAPKAKPR